MSEHFLQERALANEISILRRNGEILQAIGKCKDGIRLSPENNFFHKILGDLYFQNGDFEEASKEYIENLKLIGDKPHLFKVFIRFFRLFERNAPVGEVKAFKEKIKKAIQENAFSEEITNDLISFLGSEIVVNQDLIDFLLLSNDDKNFRKVFDKLEEWEQQRNISCIQALISHKIKVEDYSKSKKIDTQLIIFLERTGRLDAALELIEKSQQPYNYTMQSRILRICRRIANYDIADRLLKIDDAFISKTDFNVQYELVYYFQSKNDFESLDKVLKEMQRSASSSVPIAKTLYNFYLSFDKFDEAKNLYERLRLLQEKHRSRGKSRQIEQAESEKFVWQRLKDLVSDQEHNRQMIAMRDLLKGFSHELGQPITNIRYSVQLQKLKMDKGLDTREELETLLNLILIQTSRIGHMLSRFRPIVSSKSESIVFNVKDCIEDVFEDLDTRLKGNNIAYTIKGVDDIKLYGDSIQFSQVFYNLALNSMQAIDAKGKIYVDIAVRQGNLRIYFSDDGPGIPEENHHKIFEPFFSTKDPTSGNGGEGLGLFIVWNILKIFNGTIQIDKRYCKGAKFVITLPLLEEVKEK